MSGMFAIEKRSKLHLDPPAFLCDKCMHPQIEAPLPTTPFFMAIIGSAGSGKTSMLVNLLTSKQAYKKVFHAVHVIMPSHSVASLKKNVFKNHPRMHDELDYLTLDRIMEQVGEDAEEKMNSLLVMDDVTANLKNLDVQHLLKRLIFNRRHYRLSIMILVQSYNAMPLAIRKTISHFVAYKPRNKAEFRAIFEELIFLDRDTGEALQRFVFDRPYAFLYAVSETNDLYKNFDRIRVRQRDGFQEVEKDVDEIEKEGPGGI